MCLFGIRELAIQQHVYCKGKERSNLVVWFGINGKLVQESFCRNLQVILTIRKGRARNIITSSWFKLAYSLASSLEAIVRTRSVDSNLVVRFPFGETEISLGAGRG